jgi:phosphoglycerate dehydrogenase-like enzyme
VTDPVQVVVATGLMSAATVARFASSVPAGVEVTHVPLRWDDAFSEQPLTPDDLVLFERAHVLVGFPQQIGNLPGRAPRLCWFQNYGAGYETVPIDALRDAGIGLVTAAGAGAVGVAEFAVMALLSLARRAPARYEAHQRRAWDRFPTATLAGRRATVVGAGEIGSRLCRLLAALGLRVVCVRRRPDLGPPEGATAVAGPDELLALLAETDALVLAAPAAPDTVPLSRAAFAALPPGALVVNVGRGGLIDHVALGAALEDGRLGGAWLDVTPVEPLPPDHRLWRVPNLVISAHDATAGASYPDDLARLTTMHLRQWLAGEPMSHEVLPAKPPPTRHPCTFSKGETR